MDITGGPQNDADGVLVVSAWMQGVAGQMLVRLTMSGEDSSSPTVRVVTSPDELHQAIDEWLAALGK